MLENPEDYEGYGAFNIVVKSPYISYNNNKEAVVDGETGYLEGIKPLQSDLGASINSVTAQAVSSDETMKSRVSSGQTQILWKGALSKDSISIGKYGFRGQTEDTLEYEVEVKYTDNKNFTYRAEI